MITKSQLQLTLPALRRTLRLLPSLHTIQVINCKVPRELKRALKSVTLPSVRMIVLGDGAVPLLEACPNVMHVRVCDHRGEEVIFNLKHCHKLKIFDGNVDWGKMRRDALRSTYSERQGPSLAGTDNFALKASLRVFPMYTLWVFPSLYFHVTRQATSS